MTIILTSQRADSVSDHQPHDCLLNRLFWRRSLAFVWGIHRWQVNSSHKWPVTRKMFPFDDVIMWYDLQHGLWVMHSHFGGLWWRIVPTCFTICWHKYTLSVGMYGVMVSWHFKFNHVVTFSICFVYTFMNICIYICVCVCTHTLTLWT